MLSAKDAQRLLRHMAEDPPNPLAKASLKRGRYLIKSHHRLPTMTNVGLREVRIAARILASRSEMSEEASIDELMDLQRMQRIHAAKERRLSVRENERINRLLALRIKSDALIARSPDKAAVFEKAFLLQTMKTGCWPPRPRRESVSHVVCLVDDPDTDLVVGNAYEAIGVPDEHGTLRVIDDSGEDYLYPAKWFVGLVEFVASCRDGG